MDWLRLYTGVLNNPKVERLPGELLKSWINLLCLARLHNGRIPKLEDVTFNLRCSDQEAARILETLKGKGLLDLIDGQYIPHDWEDFQYTSDAMTSTERVRRSRERKKVQPQTAPAAPISPPVLTGKNETLHETLLERSVKQRGTLIERENRTEQNYPLELQKAISTEEHTYIPVARDETSNGNGWHAFTEAYESTGRQTTEADFKNCKSLWVKLELADQLACVSGIRRDIEKQKYSGPEFWPKPKKYIFEREWDRKPQPPKKSKKRDVMEGVFDA